jgi:hypothetical protein
METIPLLMMQSLALLLVINFMYTKVLYMFNPWKKTDKVLGLTSEETSNLRINALTPYPYIIL